MAGPEFIFLNGQAARVTSIVRDPGTSGFTLVLIARGAADRDQLSSLLNSEDLSVRMEDMPEQRMRSTGLDIRSTGNGPQAVHRIQVRLEPVTESPAAQKSPGARSIEDRLDEIIALLKEIRDRG